MLCVPELFVALLDNFADLLLVADGTIIWLKFWAPGCAVIPGYFPLSKVLSSSELLCLS